MEFLRELLKKITNAIIPKEDDDAHEFKPILAEIEERPQNPIGNLMFWFIISFMVIAVCWMYFGKVDVVITARGKIIPYGEEKLVQSLDKGVVTELNVKEGDFVNKNDVVAIISPAEHEPGLELNNLAQEEAMLTEQLATNTGRLSIDYAKRNRLMKVADIIARDRIDELNAEIITLEHEIKRIRASLFENQNRRKQIEKQKQILKSPITGYVSQVFVHTIGGVVTPAEKIISVVPKDAALQIKAQVLNQDIGFIEVGMPVSVKIDTFNFQKYGVLEGEVSVISPNSVEDEHLGPIYEVYIKPITTRLMVEGKEQSIQIGMTTTNEIKINKRRIIEFFIYPLIKYLDESIKVQ